MDNIDNMDNMDVESHIYGPEIVISPHTCKPFSSPKRKPVIFWCDTCHLKLTTVRSAIQHLTGRPHKTKVTAINDPTKQDALKRKLVKPTGPMINEPAAKKIKEDPEKPAAKKNKEQPNVSDSDLKCEDCNRVFGSPIIAIQHFKGKKHAAVVAAKLVAKQSQRGQRGGRGHAGRGLGRGDGFGRGRGLMRGGINYAGGFGRGGYAAGQLMTALKNFCGEPVNNFVNPPPIYDNNLQLPSKNYYDNPTFTPTDNFIKGGGDYYNNGYHSNNYPTKNSYQMNTDATYDSFYR